MPPLDGSRIATVFLPRGAYFGLMRRERYIMVGLFAVLMLGWLDTPLRVATNFVWNLLVSATGFIEAILRPCFEQRFERRITLPDGTDDYF
ncbi:MAG: hypothetical protein ACLRZH_06625 [Ruthenibacterium lactatiformans]